VCTTPNVSKASEPVSGGHSSHPTSVCQFSVLVTIFVIAVTQIPDTSNIREERLILLVVSEGSIHHGG
jgi:hypothetical protein